MPKFIASTGMSNAQANTVTEPPEAEKACSVTERKLDFGRQNGRESMTYEAIHRAHPALRENLLRARAQMGGFRASLSSPPAA